MHYVMTLSYQLNGIAKVPCLSLILQRCLEFVLEEINHNRKANVMVASHNEDTVKFTLEK